MSGPQTQHKGVVYGDDETRYLLTYLLTYFHLEDVVFGLELELSAADAEGERWQLAHLGAPGEGAGEGCVRT